MLAVTRAVHFAAAIQTFGALLFLRLLAAPDGSAVDMGTALRRSRWTMPIVAVSLVATIFSGAMWLGLQAADMTETSLDEVWRNGAVDTLLFETHAGLVWWVRLGLVTVLMLNVCALAVFDKRAEQRWLNATGVALAGAVLVSAAWLGHAGADPSELGPLHIALHVTHMLAAGIWLGGLLPFALLLSQAYRSAAVTELAIAHRTGIRFGNLAQLAVGILLLSGIVNTALMVDSAWDLLTGTFAGLLATKIGLLLVMLMLAAENRRRLVPKLASNGPVSATRLRANVIGELALGGLILLIAGALGITAPSGG